MAVFRRLGCCRRPSLRQACPLLPQLPWLTCLLACRRALRRLLLLQLLLLLEVLWQLSDAHKASLVASWRWRWLLA